MDLAQKLSEILTNNFYPQGGGRINIDHPIDITSGKSYATLWEGRPVGSKFSVIEVMWDGNEAADLYVQYGISAVKEYLHYWFFTAIEEANKLKNIDHLRLT